MSAPFPMDLYYSGRTYHCPAHFNCAIAFARARDLTAPRVIDLAEVLHNLHVPGFDECIAKMRNGDNEGTYAELDLGRMLYLNQMPFRSVVPQKVKGRSPPHVRSC